MLTKYIFKMYTLPHLCVCFCVSVSVFFVISCLSIAVRNALESFVNGIIQLNYYDRNV